MTTWTKQSEAVDYGVGHPGYKETVTLLRDGVQIARAYGPNLRGWNVGAFRDHDAAMSFRALPDGPIADDVDVLAMLSPYHPDTAAATDD